LDSKGVSHVFKYDTPWHPDDYVHRIGRTGRAGASGRAFTFVTKADAEAIDNVEKLTKSKIDVFGKSDVRVAMKDAPAKGDKPKRARKPREEKPQVDERPAKPRREQPAKAEKSEPRRTRRDEEDEPVAPGEWNGPPPGFLGVGFD
jgi:superfamily II DNA/RNA helicase